MYGVPVPSASAGRFVRLILVGASLVVWMGGATSCKGPFVKPRINPPLGLNGSEVLVVPFRESRARKWYGESERGLRVAEAIKQWALQNAEEPLFAEGSHARQVLTAIRDWTEGDIGSSDWQKLVKGLGVRYVVTGDVLHVELKSPQVVGLYDASARARYQVIDVEKGRVILEREPEVHLGRSERPDIVFSGRFERDHEVEAKLLTLLGVEIAKELYGYHEG